MLTSAQIRAARALLGWRQSDLARASKIGAATVRRVEKSAGVLSGYVSTLQSIQSAFEQAGIQFVDDKETGDLGVILKRRRRRRDLFAP